MSDSTTSSSPSPSLWASLREAALGWVPARWRSDEESRVARRVPIHDWSGALPGQPVKVHWGYPDPSNTEGGEVAQRRAFELTRQAIGYRMMQLLALPLEKMDRHSIQAALIAIGES